MEAHRALLTEDQYDSIAATTTVCATFSLLGSSFIIISWIKFRTLRNFAFEQVLNMAAADLGISLTDFLGNPSEGGSLCTLQGLLQQFFELASVLWTTVIAFNLYGAIMRQEARARGLWWCRTEEGSLRFRRRDRPAGGESVGHSRGTRARP